MIMFSLFLGMMASCSKLYLCTLFSRSIQNLEALYTFSIPLLKQSSSLLIFGLRKILGWTAKGISKISGNLLFWMFLRWLILRRYYGDCHISKLFNEITVCEFTGTGFVQFFLGFNTIMSSEKKFGKRVSSVWPPSGIYIENIMVSNEKEVKFSFCPLSLSLSLRQLYQEQKTKRLKTLEIS